jgi:uncharacterized protein (DUF1810 family)
MPQADGSDPPDDPFDLARFVAAQAPVYGRVVAELRAGRKGSHWMWFIFPQAAGLGSSAMSVRYAIGSGDEARAYLAHPVLGARLRECTTLVERALASRTLVGIFGSLDAMKFRSSMELFGVCDPTFAAILNHDGRPTTPGRTGR